MTNVDSITHKRQSKYKGAILEITLGGKNFVGEYVLGKVFFTCFPVCCFISKEQHTSPVLKYFNCAQAVLKLFYLEHGKI